LKEGEMTVHNISRVIASSVLLMIVGCLNLGCVKSISHEYEPFIQDLDGKNELYISTYPSGYPNQVSRIPFLYKELRSPDSVYFQVFIREAGKAGGRNPNIESIVIHSFSYEFPTQEPVELISDYKDYFWMQGDPKDNPGGSAPVPYNDHWNVKLKIKLTVNGQLHSLEKTVHAKPREKVFSMLLYIFA
jgi:hypothetical protein